MMILRVFHVSTFLVFLFSQTLRFNSTFTFVSDLHQSWRLRYQTIPERWWPGCLKYRPQRHCSGANNYKKALKACKLNGKHSKKFLEMEYLLKICLTWINTTCVMSSWPQCRHVGFRDFEMDFWWSWNCMASDKSKHKQINRPVACLSKHQSSFHRISRC